MSLDETEILIRYEENIWAALERLSERSMKSGAQLSYLGTFISKNSNVKGENKLEVFGLINLLGG